MQGQFNGRLDAQDFQIRRRITVEDMKANFDKLNDLLYIKFTQLEDMKAAQRDMLNYQKNFYPMEM